LQDFYKDLFNSLIIYIIFKSMLDNFGNTIILITKCIKFNEKF